MAFDGEAIYERDTPAGGVAGGSPVAHLEQHRPQHPDLDHFAANAVDFHPISNPKPVAAHQREPAEERHDEVFERHGEAGGRESDDGGHLVWRSEDDQQNEQRSYELNANGGDHAHLMEALVVRQPIESPADAEVYQDHGEQDAEHRHQ